MKIDYNNYFSILQEKFEKIVGENIKHKVNYGFAAGNGIWIQIEILINVLYKNIFFIIFE